MNICKLFWKWLMFAAMPMYIEGGDQESETKTDNSNTITDKRQVVDGEAIGVTADGSTVTVNRTTNNTMTDLGAIAKSFEFSGGALKGLGESFKQVVDFAGDSLMFAEATSKASATAQGNATDQVKAAFSAVQDTASGNRSLAFVGIIAAALVGISAYSKGK